MGEIETEGSVLVIRRITVTYHLEVDPDVEQAVVDRVMATHEQGCPVYRSLHPQIMITTRLQQSVRAGSA